MRLATSPRALLRGSRRAFTLVELLVVVAIVAVLAALILPVLGKMNETARGTKCQSNLRQLSAALIAYRTDHQMQFPKAYDTATGISWLQALMKDGETQYIGSSKITFCPTFGPQWDNTSGGYAMTSLILWYPFERTDDEPRFFSTRLKRASSWPLLMDADFVAVYGLDDPQKDASQSSRFAARHNGFANVAMADGHVERVQYGDTRWNQSELNNGDYY